VGEVKHDQNRHCLSDFPVALLRPAQLVRRRFQPKDRVHRKIQPIYRSRMKNKSAFDSVAGHQGRQQNKEIIDHDAVAEKDAGHSNRLVPRYIGFCADFRVRRCKKQGFIRSVKCARHG
jgi:hypothetical protein